MNQHPYIRAYLAGIAVPTLFLLVVMTGYTVLRYVYNFPVPVERIIVFPMAVVPNLWGLWNILFVASRARLRLSIGLFGALLPILLVPLGIVVANLLNFSIPEIVTHAFPILATVALLSRILAGILTGMLVYYLAWKYLVGFLNRVLEVA